MLHAPPSLEDLVACSKEAAGIADGIAALIIWGGLIIVVTLVVATASGIMVGMRKGRIGHQVFIHVLCAAGFLAALPVLAGAVIMMHLAYTGWNVARVTKDYDAWLAPLRQAKAGELDRAIETVMNAPDADALARRVYLIAALPNELEKIDIANLNERERRALVAAARQLRTENDERKLGSHPSNLERLDGAVAWFTERPNLPAALGACDRNRQCVDEVLVLADRWCWRHGDACRAAITPAHIAEASALFHRNDEDSRLRVKQIGRRAEAGR